MAEFEYAHLQGIGEHLLMVWRRDTYLQQIREVDEHIVPGLFLSASDIDADRDDMHAASTAREFVFEGKRVQSSCSKRYNI